MTGEEQRKVFETAKARTHHQLVDDVVQLVNDLTNALNVMEEFGDFKNGNVHNGVDEGEALTNIYIGSLREGIKAKWELT